MFHRLVEQLVEGMYSGVDHEGFLKGLDSEGWVDVFVWGRSFREEDLILSNSQ